LNVDIPKGELHANPDNRPHIIDAVRAALDRAGNAGASTETIKTAASHTPTEQQIIDLSNAKWVWMADKKVDALATLFDDRAMFTHMGGTWGKAQELATIKSGVSGTRRRRSKRSMFACSATLQSSWRIWTWRLSSVLALLPMRSWSQRVYSKQSGTWRLAQLTFSHLLRPVRAGTGSNEHR
jgi:hypothetical protein